MGDDFRNAITLVGDDFIRAITVGFDFRRATTLQLGNSRGAQIDDDVLPVVERAHHVRRLEMERGSEREDSRCPQGNPSGIISGHLWRDK